jgi:hypothetical protein
MADIARQLLDAIATTLATETATGGDLEDVGSFFVLYTASATPPNYGTVLPCVVVRMDTVTSEPIDVQGCMHRKVYPIRFGIFTEDNGDNEDTASAEILDALEDVFFNKTFGLSQLVEVVSKDYTQTSLQPFSGDWNGSGELVMAHVDTDMRSI